MSGSYGETVEHQAYITRFLLEYTAVPLVGGSFLRGVLPTRDAVRIVTGADDAVTPSSLVAYEIPLVDDEDEPVTAPVVLGWTRTLTAVGPAYPHASVMGMTLVRVDTSMVEPAPPTRTDRVLRVLRTLAWPFTETPPSPPLCGFLLTEQDSMRLYIAVGEADGPVAVDVRLTGALTALLAALPALVHEKERWKPTDGADPHCVRAIDLTIW
ncbi:hypothetical protein GCM10015535_33180 [Streptomyces gelaticus]|uniref:Uncharacterized protein n=1 Tax=Streptomyces gelaticus TaxID=285446 RepID=A0ABQ2W213_9ACTN|nr:hypothetical protein [Streptomyces gelaticus]GGV85864.1 hypothetical protein GCM10015535_33180 [Streptomyces gelaticus]